MTAVDHELAEQKLKNKVSKHGECQNQKIVGSGGFCQISEPGRKGSKYKIKAKHLCHGNRDVCRRLKRESAIERKVPNDREQKRRQIRDPIGLDKDLQKCERADLNNTCGDGEQGEFYNLQNLFFSYRS